MEIRVEDPLRGTNRGQTNGISRLEAALDGVIGFFNPMKKGGLFSRPLIAGEGFEPPTFGL